MLFSFSQCVLTFAIAINIDYVKGIMVESIDGRFVPLSFVARAPGDALAVRMINNHDLAYLATVLMGTPAQQVQMAVSLSQDHISVATPQEGVNNASFYNPAASSSYMPSSNEANISTISGQTTIGRIVGEKCTLQASMDTQPFTYNASVVLTDPNVTSDLFPPGAFAILGYGVSNPNSGLLHAFLPQNFTNAICGFELNHFDDPFQDGILTMGALDPAAFTGEFTNVMVPLSSTTAWSIPIDTITYPANGTNQGVAGTLASIDMYHTGIQVTNDVARQIYSSTQGAQAISDTEWSIPCNSTFSISLTFGGKLFTITERDTILQQSSGLCTGVITGGATQAIGKVGAPFLRNFYTQFIGTRLANGTVQFIIGFAEKNQRQAPSLTRTIPQTTIGSSSTSTSTTNTSGSQTIPNHSLSTLGFMLVSIAAVIFL